MSFRIEDVKDLRKRIGVGLSVAHELLVLSGGDVDLAERCSRHSDGLDQCKAEIIDARFEQLEGECWNEYRDNNTMFECNRCHWSNWDTTDSDAMKFCPGCRRRIVDKNERNAS